MSGFKQVHLANFEIQRAAICECPLMALDLTGRRPNRKSKTFFDRQIYLNLATGLVD